MGYAEEIKINTVMFHPNSFWRIAWDVTSIIVLIINFIYIPIYFFIMSEQEQHSYTFYNMFFDVWFIVDIWLSFNTGVIPNENLKTIYNDNDIVMTSTEVRQYYIQNWFLIDLVS